MTRPIFVTGPARSGTSMVAGLLAAHGVWTGTSSKKGAANPKGWFENDLFLENTRDSIGPKGPVPDDWSERWPELMRGDGWDGEQRWLVKAMPWAWKYLRPFDPVVVFCWRPATRVLKSQEAVGWGEHPRRVLSHWDMMRDIRFKAPHVDIPTERLGRGEYAQTRQAFEAIGILFSEARANEWIDRKIWNRS